MKLIQILKGFVIVALPCLLLCSSYARSENEFSKNIPTEEQQQANNENMDTEEGENIPPQYTENNADKNQEKNQSGKVKPENKEEGVDWSFWLSILSVGVSFGALFVAICNHKEFNKFQDKIKTKLPPNSNSIKPSGIKDNIPDLLKKIQVLEIAVNELKGQMAKKKEESNKTPSSQQQNKVVKKEEVQKNDPVEYGYFNQPVGGEKAYFKEFLSESPRAIFKVEKRGNVAIFFFCDNVNIKQVVSADFLSSAIDLIGVLKHEAVGMTTTSKGQAEWKNDKWVITKKMVVLLS